MLLTAIVFILILSVLVLIHEGGHFFMAKKLGIKVEEFGFGFPPKVWGFKRGETEYTINLLPIGGFVKLYGEDEAGSGKIKIGEKVENRSKVPDIKRAFFARPPWQKALVVVAGVAMNFLLAVVVISYLFATQGVTVPSSTVRIVEVQPGTPAQTAGLKSGDVIESINNQKIDATEKFIQTTRKYLGQEVTLVISREGKESTVKITPRKNYPEGEGPIGFAISNVELKKYAWYEAPFFGTVEAFKFSWIIIESIGRTLFDLVAHGTKPQGVAGPIGVAQLTGQVVTFGFSATIWFAALLSLNLAVLNIFPIPALDGGRLFFILIEMVFRKKVNPRYESMAHAVGLAILLGLIVLITISDVARLLAGKSVLQP